MTSDFFFFLDFLALLIGLLLHVQAAEFRWAEFGGEEDAFRQLECLMQSWRSSNFRQQLRPWLAFHAEVYIHPRCDSSQQLEPCWISNGEDLLMLDGGHQSCVDYRPVNVGVQSPECLAFVSWQSQPHLKTN